MSECGETALTNERSFNMAKNTPKKVMTPFEKMLTTITVLVILAVLALAVFATYGKISGNLKQAALDAETTAIENGEQAATIRYMASSSGMSAADYVAQYGLELKDGLTETSTLDDMAEKMTLENYYKFSDETSGETTDVDALLTEWGADELGITKDTVWGEVKSKLPLSKFMGEDDFNNLVAQYAAFGYDSSAITADMTIEQANEAVEEMISNGPVNSPEVITGDAAETGDADESAEVPAE